MRAFVGTLLSAAEAASLSDLTTTLLQASGGRLRGVPAGTLHLTYTFIGELPEARVEAVAQAIAHATRGTAPTSVTFGAPEVLYGGREARLVLLPAIDGAAWLADLARRLADALGDALPGTPVSPTPAPHVTLARFGRGTTRPQARDVEMVIEEQLRAFTCASHIDVVQLVESRLSTAGPTYFARHAHALADAAAR